MTYEITISGFGAGYFGNIPDKYMINAWNLRYFGGRKTYYLLAYEIRQTRLIGAF